MRDYIQESDDLWKDYALFERYVHISRVCGFCTKKCENYECELIIGEIR